jgi:SAM-dependent methyltransferase
MILNLGCGNNPIKEAWNVDITKGNMVDEVVNLKKFPWKWKTGSCDEVWAIHVIEHFPSQERFIKECYRILKKGGKLHLIVPHSSSVMSIGCMGHYRTYSYDTLRDYLSRPFYMFKKTMFHTEHQELRWWYGRPTVNVPKFMLYFIIYPMNFIINRLIKLSPQVFENGWCYWVGGAKEVYWRGKKL